MKRLLIGLCLLSLGGNALGSDLHILWDRQCGGCHGHAGAFARMSLEWRGELWYGRQSGHDLASLLATHNGGYPPDDISAIITMLSQQAKTEPLFQEQCGQCHETAAKLGRDWLIVRDGTLSLRRSGQALADFLPTHHRIPTATIAPIIESLTRVMSEIGHR